MGWYWQHASHHYLCGTDHHLAETDRECDGRGDFGSASSPSSSSSSFPFSQAEVEQQLVWWWELAYAILMTFSGFCGLRVRTTTMMNAAVIKVLLRSLLFLLGFECWVFGSSLDCHSCCHLPACVCHTQSVVAATLKYLYVNAIPHPAILPGIALFRNGVYRQGNNTSKAAHFGVMLWDHTNSVR
jgi:hypothetical protein